MQYNRTASLRATATLATPAWAVSVLAVAVKPSQLGIQARGTMPTLHQQIAQKRIALLADAAQSLFAAAGALPRNQSEIAGHLARPGKPFRRAQRDHERQADHRPYSGMGHQPYRVGSRFGFA